MNNPAHIYWTINQAGESFSSLPLSDLEALLSPSERVRYAAMKIQKRRNEWLLGRLTAKGLLTANGLPLAGLPFNAISIDNHPEGAPLVSSHPHLGAISITHREKVAASAFSPDNEVTVGIDLEWIEPRQSSFVEDFFTPNEVNYIQSIRSESARNEKVTLIWSAKEAFLKAWQKGLRLDTRHIEILPDQSENEEMPGQWNQIKWTTDLIGYPMCWLGWRRWGNFIITLAVSGKDKITPPIITEITITNFPK